MEKIVPPIRLQDHGPAAANLQEALLFIVEKRQLTQNNLSLAFRLTQRYKATRTLLNKAWDSALLLGETLFSHLLESAGADLGGFDTTACYKKSKQMAATKAHTHSAIYEFKDDLCFGALNLTENTKDIHWDEL